MMAILQFPEQTFSYSKLKGATIHEGIGLASRNLEHTQTIETFISLGSWSTDLFGNIFDSSIKQANNLAKAVSQIWLS